MLRATTACTFSTSQLPKVVRQWCVLYLYILTSKCALRHNGVQIFISHLASWLRTRRFSEPTFVPSPNHRKNTVFRDSYLFAHLHLLSSDSFSSDLLSSNLSLLSASSLLCFSSVHIVGSLTSKLPSNISSASSRPLRPNAHLRSSKGSCSGISLVNFDTHTSSTTCCPVDSLSCGGCAKYASSKCEQCLGGFLLKDGKCTACISTVGWTNELGDTCDAIPAADCNDRPVNGLSSNQACCQCNGGEKTATPFSYPDNPLCSWSCSIIETAAAHC